jgi:acyl carrier protein
MNDLTAPPDVDGKHTWEHFAAAVAGIAQVQAQDIAPTTRLDNDLGLDSLALTELVVLLIVDFDMESLEDDLDDRDWAHVTVGALYDEYTSGRRAQPG